MDTLCRLLASLKRAYFTIAIRQSQSEERNGVHTYMDACMGSGAFLSWLVQACAGSCCRVLSPVVCCLRRGRWPRIPAG